MNLSCEELRIYATGESREEEIIRWNAWEFMLVASQALMRFPMCSDTYCKPMRLGVTCVRAHKSIVWVVLGEGCLRNTERREYNTESHITAVNVEKGEGPMGEAKQL